MKISFRHVMFSLVALALPGMAATATAQIPIPGQGTRVWSDDFEDAEWKYYHQGAKSSREQDEQVRSPRGQSVNAQWFESAKRGHPDVIRTVDTPEGGIEGSTKSLELRTLYSGIPGRLSGELMQDDLIGNCPNYSVNYYPSAVTRVYLPPFEQWENYSGAATFGFRTAVYGSRTKITEKKGLFGGTRKEDESTISWPGIFIQFVPGSADGKREDQAYWVIRGHQYGDFQGPKISQTGWWTLGMSFSPDGKCHYFVSPGVDDLKAEDRLASHYPYDFKIEEFRTMFFNVFNYDNGRSWSTPWVVDEPAVYLGRGGARTAQRQ
jgi:hypothetical protein